MAEDEDEDEEDEDEEDEDEEDEDVLPEVCGDEDVVALVQADAVSAVTTMATERREADRCDGMPILTLTDLDLVPESFVHPVKSGNVAEPTRRSHPRRDSRGRERWRARPATAHVASVIQGRVWWPLGVSRRQGGPCRSRHR